MNRIFVTGDCHGSVVKLIDFIQKYDLKDDGIIVLGDMGLFWQDNQEDAKFNINLYEKNCNGVHLYWLDGNHENFNIINSWNCDKNHLYNNSEHIHYCPRGFSGFIGNKSVLFMGGADSVDKFIRKIRHLGWWENETITDADVDKVIEGAHYNYVFSHCCPYSEVQQAKHWLFTLSNINENNAIHESEKQLDKVKNKITFDNWIFGHYHVEKQINDKFRCIYNDFIELEQ